MKKFFSIALVLVMVLTFAVSAMASGSLYSVADSWYFNAEKAGTLTVRDNFKEYIYNVVAGENFLGLQRNFTGQLSFVSFEAEHVCFYVKTLVGAEVGAQIEKVSGNTNPYTFSITEEFEHVCECGNRLDNTFETNDYTINLPNNYKGDVAVGNYNVYIYSYGNTGIEALYIIR